VETIAAAVCQILTMHLGNATQVIHSGIE